MFQPLNIYSLNVIGRNYRFIDSMASIFSRMILYFTIVFTVYKHLNKANVLQCKGFVDLWGILDDLYL